MHRRYSVRVSHTLRSRCRPIRRRYHVNTTSCLNGDLSKCPIIYVDQTDAMPFYDDGMVHTHTHSHTSEDEFGFDF